MIHLLKYKQKLALKPAFQALLDQSGTHDMDFSCYDLIIPVPLHIRRLRERGFNQAVVWGEIVGETYCIPVKRAVLRRSTWTTPQVTLHGATRKENIRDAFSVRDASAVRNKSVLLVDDVYTTGATMGECAAVLRQVGAVLVDGFVIARAV